MAHAEMVTSAPTTELRDYVETYIGYRLEGFGPGRHQGLPSPYLTVVISLDDPVELVALPDGSTDPRAHQALVGGLHSRPATIRHGGRQFGMHVELTPAGARALFGMPAAALADAVVDLGDILGKAGHALVERLAVAPDWTTRFGLLDAYFGSRLREARATSAELYHAWALLVGSGGAASVGRLADEVGWTRRHLARRFRNEFGLTPKRAGRVVRFSRACEILRKPDAPGLCDVAATCGFYDQAHLSREWRELAGLTPTEWLAEALPHDAEPIGQSMG